MGIIMIVKCILCAYLDCQISVSNVRFTVCIGRNNRTISEIIESVTVFRLGCQSLGFDSL